MILLLNQVSATENLVLSDNNPNNSIDNDNIILLNDENSIIHIGDECADIKATAKEQLKSENDNDFESIQQLIDNANDGDSIHLENKTYKGNGTPITVNKNISIYGYQYQNDINTVLDANSKSNIFLIDSNVCLNIYGLKFINGNSYNGGTITNRGTLYISNSVFENNKGSNGGAIYTTNFLSVSNSSFNRNSAFEAGAIYNLGDLTISNSNFTRQKVSHKAGVIFSNFGNLNITNSIFKYSSGSDEGGAIFASGGFIYIKTSRFSINNAISYGGAIDNGAIMTIEDSEFDGNSAYGAGAIDNGGDLKIINCHFSKNKATVNGGAIDSNNKLNIIGSIIENNSANGNGGAILSRGDTNISHCIIINNKDSSKFEIYCQENNIALNNNWWGSNNPKFEEIINRNIDDDFRWIIMNFTNLTQLKQSLSSELIIGFNQTTDRNNNLYDLKDSSRLPDLKGNIILEDDYGKSIFKINVSHGCLLKSFDLGSCRNISAIINDELITLDILENDDEDNESDENEEDMDNKSDENEDDNDNEPNIDADDWDKKHESSNKYIDKPANPEDFADTKDFDLNKFKENDFSKSIGSHPIDSNLDNGSKKEINDKGQTSGDEGNNDKNLILTIPTILALLLILIAFKRKKDDDEEEN